MGKKDVSGVPHYEELPTPKTETEILTVVEEAIACRLNWIHGDESNGWKNIGTEGGALLEQLNLPNTTIKVIRASKTLNNVDVTKIIHALKESDLHARKRIYDELMTYQIVNEVNNQVHIGYSQYATPSITSNRDFVAIQAHKEFEDGSHIVVVQSINHEGVVTNKGFVRGISNCGIFLKPLGPKKIQVISVEYVDPKGSVPSFLLNVYKKKAGQRLNNVESLFYLPQ